jgi:predicted dienelactone hydrolase
MQDAPIDQAGAPYPLVLFVHGSFSSRVTSKFLLESIARAGYVVAAADFPLTATSTAGGSSDLHVADQRDDLEFLANQIGAMVTGGGDWAGAVDATRYVVAGHSTGGAVALVALYAPDRHDARVAGGIAMASDACFFGDSFFRTRELPLLVLAGSDDHLVPAETNTARAYALAGAPKVSAEFVGGKHLGFTNLNLNEDTLGLTPTTTSSDLAVALQAYGGGTGCEPFPPPSSDAPMALDEQRTRTSAWVAAFVDRVLTGHGEDLTHLEGAVDPAVVVQHDGL